MRWSRLAVILALLCGAFSSIRAGDHDKIEEGLPVRMESAYPIPYLGRELQGLVRYERTRRGEDNVFLESRLEFGFPRNGELLLAVPFEFGESEPDDVGDVKAEFLYNLNQETLVLPAFSGAASLELPTGEEGRGVDPELKLLVTKTIGPESDYQQLHLNLGWRFNDDVRDRERNDSYELVLGYSRRLTTSLMFVADLVREKEVEEDEEANLAEFGLRYQLTPLSVLSAGAGFGFGDESPDVQLTFGFQLAF